MLRGAKHFSTATDYGETVAQSAYAVTVYDPLSSSFRACTVHEVLVALGPLLRITRAVFALPDAEVRYPPPTTRFDDGQDAVSVRMLLLSEMTTEFDAAFS
jgi:hypothetical protein